MLLENLRTKTIYYQVHIIRPTEGSQNINFRPSLAASRGRSLRASQLTLKGDVQLSTWLPSLSSHWCSQRSPGRSPLPPPTLLALRRRSAK